LVGNRNLVGQRVDRNGRGKGHRHENITLVDSQEENCKMRRWGGGVGTLVDFTREISFTPLM
jgi:hypothetical protein